MTRMLLTALEKGQPPSAAMSRGIGVLKPWIESRWGLLPHPVPALRECGCSEACVVYGYGEDFGYEDDSDGVIPARYLASWLEVRRCPADDCSQHHHTASMLAHLNDDHLWERERARDWLRSVGL